MRDEGEGEKERGGRVKGAGGYDWLSPIVVVTMATGIPFKNLPPPRPTIELQVSQKVQNFGWFIQSWFSSGDQIRNSIM